MGYAEVNDKVVLVTGAAGGIGGETVQSLSDGGARLVMVDVEEQGLRALDERLTGGGERESIVASVVRSDDVQRAVARTMERFGRLDALVNVAGGATHGLTVPGMSEEYWDEVLDLNLKSVFLTCHWAIPALVESGGGSIVNISSGAGIRGMHNKPAYCAAKAGVIGLTKALALDHGDDGVRVNAVAPGPIFTAGMRARRTPEEVAELGAVTILGRLGDPAEIAAAVRFLVSDAASYVTGQTFEVDGGVRGRV